MPLYYRADTRSPGTIFREGFKPRRDWSFYSQWWKLGIRDEPTLGADNKVPDANMDNVICLTKKLESAPIFPTCSEYYTDYDSEMYIYVMVLPDAKLPQDFNARQDDLDVFDMEAFQVNRVKKLLRDTPNANPAVIGYTLCGREVFTQKVLPENIICAIKCKRSDFALSAGLSVFSEQNRYVAIQDRHFAIGSKVFVNPTYCNEQCHYDEAIAQVRDVKAKGWQPTTSVTESLDACGIIYDKKQITQSTYAWQEWKSLHFGMVFFSLLESLTYYLMQFIKLFNQKAEQEPLEIIRDLQNFPEDRPQRKTLSHYGRYFSTVGVLTGEADPMQAMMVRMSMA